MYNRTRPCHQGRSRGDANSPCAFTCQHPARGRLSQHTESSLIIRYSSQAALVRACTIGSKRSPVCIVRSAANEALDAEQSTPTQSGSTSTPAKPRSIYLWPALKSVKQRPGFLKYYPAQGGTFNINSFLGNNDTHKGKFLVPEEQYEDFLMDYYRAFHEGYLLFLAEMYGSQPFRYFIELDFEWDTDEGVVKDAFRDVLPLIKACVQECFERNNQPRVLVSMRTPYKVHLNFPSVVTTELQAFQCRELILEKCKQELSAYDGVLDWERVLDFPHGSFRMLGSRKTKMMIQGRDPSWVVDMAYYPVVYDAERGWVPTAMTADRILNSSIIPTPDQRQKFESSPAYLNMIFQDMSVYLAKAKEKAAKRLSQQRQEVSQSQELLKSVQSIVGGEAGAPDSASDTQHGPAAGSSSSESSTDEAQLVSPSSDEKKAAAFKLGAIRKQQHVALLVVAKRSGDLGQKWMSCKAEMDAAQGKVRVHQSEWEVARVELQALEATLHTTTRTPSASDVETETVALSSEAGQSGSGSAAHVTPLESKVAEVQGRLETSDQARRQAQREFCVAKAAYDAVTLEMLQAAGVDTELVGFKPSPAPKPKADRKQRHKSLETSEHTAASGRHTDGTAAGDVHQGRSNDAADTKESAVVRRRSSATSKAGRRDDVLWRSSRYGRQGSDAGDEGDGTTAQQPLSPAPIHSSDGASGKTSPVAAPAKPIPPPPKWTGPQQATSPTSAAAAAASQSSPALSPPQPPKIIRPQVVPPQRQQRASGSSRETEAPSPSSTPSQRREQTARHQGHATATTQQVTDPDLAAVDPAAAAAQRVQLLQSFETELASVRRMLQSSQAVLDKVLVQQQVPGQQAGLSGMVKQLQAQQRSFAQVEAALVNKIQRLKQEMLQ